MIKEANFTMLPFVINVFFKVFYLFMMIAGVGCMLRSCMCWMHVDRLAMKCEVL